MAGTSPNTSRMVIIVSAGPRTGKTATRVARAWPSYSRWGCR